MTNSNFRTVSGLIKFTNASGSYFFSKGAVRVFNSVTHSLHKVSATGGYIVTSERFDEESPLEYSVRRYVIDGCSIDFDTVDRFESREAAEAEARLLWARS